MIRLRDSIGPARDGIATVESDFTDTPDRVLSEQGTYWTRFETVTDADAALGLLRPKAEMHFEADGTDTLMRSMPLWELRGAGIAHFKKRNLALVGHLDLAAVLDDDRAVMYRLRGWSKGDPDPFGEKVNKAVGDALAFFDKRARL